MWQRVPFVCSLIMFSTASSFWCRRLEIYAESFLRKTCRTRTTTEATYRVIDPPCYAAGRYLKSFAFICSLCTEFRKLYQVQDIFSVSSGTPPARHWDLRHLSLSEWFLSISTWFSGLIVFHYSAFSDPISWSAHCLYIYDFGSLLSEMSIVDVVSFQSTPRRSITCWLHKGIQRCVFFYGNLSACLHLMLASFWFCVASVPFWLAYNIFLIRAIDMTDTPKCRRAAATLGHIFIREAVFIQHIVSASLWGALRTLYESASHYFDSVWLFHENSETEQPFFLTIDKWKYI